MGPSSPAALEVTPRRRAAEHAIALLVLAAATLWLAPYLVGRDFNLVLDAVPHAGRTEMVRESLSQGYYYPTWSNDWYCGYPLLQFYPPLYFWITGTIAWITGSVFLATKAVLFTGLILAGFMMYLYVRQMTRSAPAATLAGLAFSVNPMNLSLLLVDMRTTHIAAYIMLPCLWWRYERFRQGRDGFARAGLSLGLALGVFIIFHHGYALFGSELLLIWAALHAVEGRRRRPEMVTVVLLGLAVAAGLALFFIVPYVAEAGNTMVFSYQAHRGVTAFNFPPDHTLGTTLTRGLFMSTRRVTYLGASLAGLGLAGGAAALAFGRGRGWRLAVMLGLSGFLLYGYRAPGYGWFPLVYSQLEIARLTIYPVFFLAALLGAGLAAALTRLGRRRGRRWLAGGATAGLMVLVLADYSVARRFTWPSWERREHIHDGGMLERYARELRDADARRPDRALAARFYVFGPDWFTRARMNNMLTMLSGLPSPPGSFHQVVTPEYEQLLDSTQNWLLAEFAHAGGLSKSRDALRLLDVAEVMYLDDRAGSEARRSAVPACPALASTVLLPYRAERIDAAELCAAMRLDPQRDRAAALLIDPRFSLPPLGPASPGPDEFTVTSFRQDLRLTRLNVRADRPLYVRVSHRYYPYLDVRLNGRPAAYARSPEDFLLVAVPAGESEIVISPRLSRLRKVTMGLSAIALAAWWGWWRAVKKRKTIAAPAARN
jgi:hypothetical protein